MKRAKKAGRDAMAECPEGCQHIDAGEIHLGVPGALGTLQIERCDACERFKTDEDAERHVRNLLNAATDMYCLLGDLQIVLSDRITLPQPTKANIRERISTIRRRAEQGDI